MWWLCVGNRRGMHNAPPLQGHVPRLGHTPPGKILPSLCGLIPNVIAPPPLPHSPLTSPGLHLKCGTTFSMLKRMAASLHTFVKRPPLISWRRTQNRTKTCPETTSPTRMILPIAFQELLSKIDSRTKELPNVLSTKHYAALTQLPLTYSWARLVLDLKELLISFDRSPDHVPYCQPGAGQRHSPPVHGPFKFSPPPRSAHFTHHCPAWYR